MTRKVKSQLKDKKKTPKWVKISITVLLLAIVWTIWAELTGVIILRKTEDMARSENSISILFVGDSFVFVGDLPRQLKTIAGAHGIEITYRDISRHANRGGTLREHRENATKEMQSGKFDYVVLHDQNVQSLNDMEGLLDDIRALCTVAKENGVVPVLYDFAGLAIDGQPDEERLRTSIDAYKQAADENDAILVRAAEAWIYAYKTIPGISLYARFDPRGLHPNKAGGFLTACVFAATLFDLHIENIPKDSLYKGSDIIDLANSAWEFTHSPP